MPCKRTLFSLLLSLSFVTAAPAQNYITKNGTISFYSRSTLEDIDAVNNQVVSVLNIQKGDIAFSVLVKGFLFKKALMQEHFNEDYMESDKYQKAIFKGNIADMGKVNFTKSGIYPVMVSGDLTLHGVTRKISTGGTIQVRDSKIAATSEFNIRLADYNISIPKMVEKNISPTIRLTVDCMYEPKN